MNSKRYVCLQQSIKGKDPGQVEWTIGLFWVLILAMVMYTNLQLASWQSASMYMEDALAASNLASALIDLEEYGKTHKMIIRDYEGAYRVYCQALQDNLSLNEFGECGNRELFVGPIEIVDYIVYNVDGNRVESVQLGNDGKLIKKTSGTKGSVMAPDGSVIEYTGVYSKLKFMVKGFPGISFEAQKGKLADIVPQGGEEDENR